MSVGDSFSLSVIKRILSAFDEDSKVKRTNLASKAGLNYTTCQRYVSFLKLLNWIEISESSENEEIVELSITSSGRKFKHILFSCLNAGPSAPVVKPDNRLEECPKQKSTAPKACDSSTSVPESTSKEEENDDFDDDRYNSVKPLTTIRGEGLACSDMKFDRSSVGIMLVDDEPDTLFVYELFLRHNGFNNITTFANSKMALEHFREAKVPYYDLIITDIRMREINGLQLYQQITQLDPTAKVIFVSALDATDEVLSLFPGIRREEIIRKPVEEQKFINTIMSALLKRRNSIGTTINDGDDFGGYGDFEASLAPGNYYS
jgi:CheY-like chemotaxis protein/predicted transcriptional regulator